VSADREFTVKIQTSADLAALESTKKALDEDKQSVIGLDKEHGELMRSARELSRAFPEVAAALRLLAGPAGIIFVAVEAFVKAKEALDGWNKSLDDAIAKNADPIFLDSINAKKAAVNELADAFAKSAAESQVMITATAQVTAAMNTTVEQIKGMGTDGTDLNESLFKLDLAKLKAQLDDGLILIDQFEIARAELEIKHRHAAEAAKEKELQDEIDATTMGYRNQNANRDAAEQRAKRDEDKLEKDKGDLISDQGTLDAINKQLTDTQPGVAEAMERHGWFLDQLGAAQKQGFKQGDSQIKWITDGLADTQLTIDNFAALQGDAARVGGRIKGDKSAVSADETNLLNDETEAKEAKASMGELKKSIDELKEQLQILTQGAAKQMPDQDLTSLLQTHIGATVYTGTIMKEHAMTVMKMIQEIERAVKDITSSGPIPPSYAGGIH
jgi:hypothetical protein